MTLAEAVQLQRAEEQTRRMRRLGPRDRDEGHARTARLCYRCEEPLGEREPSRAKVCLLCRTLGYVAHRCENCDRVLHRRDVTQRKFDFRGYCSRCRETIRSNLPGYCDPEWVVSPRRDLLRRRKAR